MSIEKIVNINISLQTATVERAGFGRALILGSNASFAEDVRLYTSLSAVADDFLTTDDEYKAAAKLFSQPVKPPDVLIGKRATPVAQVNDIEITTLEDADYTVTINGTPFTHVPGGVPTNSSAVVTALIALITAGSEPVTATASGIAPDEDLVLTADNAGEAFTVAVTTNMTNVATTPSVGVQSDLTGIVDGSDLGKTWYALILTSRTTYEVTEAALWIEANKRLYIAGNGDSDIITAVSTDVASVLAAKNYNRTAVLYSGDQANFPEAAWLGVMLPKDPGSATWVFKTLAGNVADELTDTEETNAIGKNATVYIERGGVDNTQNAEGGQVASGEWIDVIRGIDWLEARLEENIYTVLVTVDKVPFTDNGIDQIVNAMQEILELAVTRGVLDTYIINRPDAADFTAAQKATRQLTGISFTGTLQGAIHKITINGTVSA
jgi:hypothetical protein